MKQIFKIAIFIVFFCTSLVLDAQTASFLNRHQFFGTASFDYYLDRNEVKKTGIEPFKIINMPGFRVGLSYNLKVSAQNKSYITTDLYYSQQYHISGYSVDVGAYLHNPNWTRSDKLVNRLKNTKQQLGILLGYEHRFPLRNSNIKILTSLKAGLTYSINDFGLKVDTYIEPFDSIQSYPFGLYASTFWQYEKGISAIPIELGAGVYIPIEKFCNLKVSLSYSNSVAGSWGTIFSKYYDMYGTQIGTASYFGMLNHLSLNFSIGFW
jgi:hypothetical protein